MSTREAGTLVKKKICMLGAFATGKTSLARRYVSGIYSEKYHTTVGVKIDRKKVIVDTTTVDLILWDLAGRDEFQDVRTSYLRGAAGMFYVVDGTRRETLDVALTIHQQVRETIGDVHNVMALNKTDLTDAWELDDRTPTDLTEQGFRTFLTSAKSGDGVEQAFAWLARATLT